MLPLIASYLGNKLLWSLDDEQLQGCEEDFYGIGNGQ